MNKLLLHDNAGHRQVCTSDRQSLYFTGLFFLIHPYTFWLLFLRISWMQSVARKCQRFKVIDEIGNWLRHKSVEWCYEGIEALTSRHRWSYVLRTDIELWRISIQARCTYTCASIPRRTWATLCFSLDSNETVKIRRFYVL